MATLIYWNFHWFDTMRFSLKSVFPARLGIRDKAEIMFNEAHMLNLKLKNAVKNGIVKSGDPVVLRNTPIGDISGKLFLEDGCFNVELGSDMAFVENILLSDAFVVSISEEMLTASPDKEYRRERYARRKIKRGSDRRRGNND